MEQKETETQNDTKEQNDGEKSEGDSLRSFVIDSAHFDSRLLDLPSLTVGFDIHFPSDFLHFHFFIFDSYIS